VTSTLAVLEGEPVPGTGLARRDDAIIPHVEAKQSEADRALARLADMPCENPKQEQVFADFLTMCRSLVDELDKHRRSFTDPLQKEKTRIDKLYKPAADRWAAVEALIRSKLQGAAQARLSAQQEAKRLAAEAASKGDVGTAVLVLAKAPEKPLVAGVGHGAEWECSEWDLARVPREYLTLDWSKIKMLCKEHKHSDTMPEIEGLTFTRKAIVRAR
jgi:hypothetical protein